MTAVMLAQADTGATVFGVLLILALLAFQIYLIFAIIATRQDVKVIRQWLLGDSAPAPYSASPPVPGRSGVLGGDDVERLRQVAELRQSGILDDDEFSRVKDAILGGWAPTRSAAPSVRSGAASPSAVGAQYAVVVQDLGTADPNRVRKILREYLDEDVTVERLTTLPLTVADGIGFATAEPLRADLKKAGVSVEMLEK
jgi:hypothetical protein